MIFTVGKREAWTTFYNCLKDKHGDFVSLNKTQKALFYIVEFKHSFSFFLTFLLW